MPTLVVSQPMYLAWRGLFEQIQLSDDFVFYDDVQLPRGRSFITRVQIKTCRGSEWLSIPVERSGHSLQRICDARVAGVAWVRKHRAALEHAYGKAPFFDDVNRRVLEPLFCRGTENLAEFCIASMRLVCDYLGLRTRFHISSHLTMPRSEDPSQRLVDYCRHFGADRYVTGHGARNYLNHELFENARIRVEYMDYRLTPYPQLHGAFCPYVSIIDLLCNVGDRATEHLKPFPMYWKECGSLFARLDGAASGGETRKE